MADPYIASFKEAPPVMVSQVIGSFCFALFRSGPHTAPSLPEATMKEARETSSDPDIAVCRPRPRGDDLISLTLRLLISKRDSLHTHSVELS